jgi:hypothetical protein
MSSKSASTRQKLLDNCVERELSPIREDLINPQEWNGWVHDDQLIWTHECAPQPFLVGPVPLDTGDLQDALGSDLHSDRELIGNSTKAEQAQQVRITERDSAFTNGFPQQSHTIQSLFGSGTDNGRIVSENPELVIQQISSVSNIARTKSIFPQVSHTRRLITDRDDETRLREIHECSPKKDLAR